MARPSSATLKWHGSRSRSSRTTRRAGMTGPYPSSFQQLLSRYAMPGCMYHSHRCVAFQCCQASPTSLSCTQHLDVICIAQHTKCASHCLHQSCTPQVQRFHKAWAKRAGEARQRSGMSWGHVADPTQVMGHAAGATECLLRFCCTA